MKFTKILAIILAIAMTLPLMLTVNADENPIVTISSVSVLEGATFKLEVTIENSPAVKAMSIEPIYDSAALELVSGVWTLDGTLKENWSAEKGDAVWSSSDDVDVNGKVFEMTFKVKDGVSDGTTTDVSCDFRLENKSMEYTVTVVDGKVTIETPASEIVSADMVLGADITVNYYATLDASHIGAQMRFTMNDEETIVDGEETEEEGVYVYPFQKIAPQCMGDNIKAELILGDTVLDTKAEYSIKTYCKNTLAKSASDLNMSEEKYAAMQTLIADLLEYGAKAQVYTGHNADALVNEGIEGKSEFLELDPEENDERLEQNSNFTLTGVEFVSAGIYFDYYNAIYVKFNAPNMTDSNFRVRLKDGDENVIATYKLSECELVDEANSTYLLVLPALYATEFENFYYIELCKYTNRATMQWSLSYGIASYVCAKQNKKDANGDLTPMAELARATYNYGLSASAYNGIAD